METLEIGTLKLETAGRETALGRKAEFVEHRATVAWK